MADQEPIRIPGERYVTENTADHMTKHNHLHTVGNVVVAVTQATFGGLLFFAAAMMWTMTAFIIPAIYLVPEFRVMPMPLFPHLGTVLDFFVRFGYPAIMMLVLTNMLSAVFAPESLQRLDYTFSRFGATIVCLVAVIVLVFDVGKKEVEIDDLIFLGTVAAYGIFDVIANRAIARERHRRDLELQLALSAANDNRPADAAPAVQQPPALPAEPQKVETVTAHTPPASYWFDNPFQRYMDAFGLNRIGPFSGVFFERGPHAIMVRVPMDQLRGEVKSEAA